MFKTAIQSFVDGFNHRPKPQPQQPSLHEEKQIWDDMDENKVDEMIDETFPASDPPANY